MGKTRNFGDVLRRKLANNPELAAQVEEAAADRHIGTEIYELRTGLGLTQAQLAQEIGSHQSVIARLEDADYEGHTYVMLKKIAAATGTRYRGSFYAKPQPPVAEQFIQLPDFKWDEPVTEFEVQYSDG